MTQPAQGERRPGHHCLRPAARQLSGTLCRGSAPRNARRSWWTRPPARGPRACQPVRRS
ncbi:hypothetical protein ACFPRL_09525 [Pseudoclavibacter helvolus]